MQHGRIRFRQWLEQPFALQHDRMFGAAKAKRGLKELFVFLNLLGLFMGKTDGNGCNVFVNHASSKTNDNQEHRFNLMAAKGFVRVMRYVDNGSGIFIYSQSHTTTFTYQPLILLYLLQRLKKVLAVHHGVSHHT